MSREVRFRFTRADWVALSAAVARRPLLFRLAVAFMMTSIVVIVMSMLASTDPTAQSMLHDALRGGSDWYPFYGLIVLLVLGTVFRHHLVAFNARMGFARMPLADKELVVELGADEVVVRANETGFDWRFPWAAITRVIETPTHLILATGGREGLPIPRSAFADEKAFADVRKTVLARLREGTPHERV
jgi:hypothetical protein